jgi:hypothetical protein
MNSDSKTINPPADLFLNVDGRFNFVDRCGSKTRRKRRDPFRNCSVRAAFEQTWVFVDWFEIFGGYIRNNLSGPIFLCFLGELF